MTPNVSALLAAVRGPEWNSFPTVSWRMWEGHRISMEATQRAMKRAEAAGLIEVRHPNRARADTWSMRRKEPAR